MNPEGWTGSSDGESKQAQGALSSPGLSGCARMFGGWWENTSTIFLAVNSFSRVLGERRADQILGTT